MPLTANFLADFSSFLKACADATTSTDELVASAGKVGATMDQAVGQAATSLRSVGAGIVEFGKSTWSVLNSSQLRQFGSDVATFAAGYIQEFAGAEAANKKLEQSLKNMGLATPEVIKAYSDMASHLQRISTFSDEAITDAISLFTTVGKVGPDNMEKVLTATMNLAAFWETDLQSASQVFLKAAASDGEALGRLKILLGETYTEGMTFNEIIDAFNTKYGGQFAAKLDTASGRAENLKNRMSDINEVIGEQLNKTLEVMFGLFEKLPESVQSFALGAYGIGKALEPVLLSLAALATLLGSTGLGGAISSAGAAILEFGGVILAGLGTALSGLGGWLLAAGEAVAGFVAGLLGWPAVIIAALAALAAAIYFYWDEIVAFIKKAVEKIGFFLTDTLPKAFTSTVQVVANWYYNMKYWLQDKFTELIDTVRNNVDLLPGYFMTAARQIVGFSIVPDMIDGIAHEFGRLDRVMVGPTLDAADEVTAAMAGIDPATLTAGAGADAWGRGGAPVTVTVNLSGMLGTDDPQTRAMVSELVSNAVMQGMRGTRLLGTA